MRAFTIAILALAGAVAATGAYAQKMRRNQDDGQKSSLGYEKPIQKEQKVFPTKVSWVVVSLNGKPFPGERPTFILDEQFRMRGFGGCNTFSATAYPLREQHFAVGPLALTKKSCDKATMDLEHQFLVALRTAQQWDTIVGDLVLKGQGGELKFERSL